MMYAMEPILAPFSREFHNHRHGLNDADAAVQQVAGALDHAGQSADRIADAWFRREPGEEHPSGESANYKNQLLQMAVSVARGSAGQASVDPQQADRAFQVACRVTFAAGMAGIFDAIGLCKEGVTPPMAFDPSGYVSQRPLLVEMARTLNHAASERLPQMHAAPPTQVEKLYRQQPVMVLRELSEFLTDGCSQNTYFKALTYAAEMAYVGGLQAGLAACQGSQPNVKAPAHDMLWAAVE